MVTVVSKQTTLTATCGLQPFFTFGTHLHTHQPGQASAGTELFSQSSFDGQEVWTCHAGSKLAALAACVTRCCLQSGSTYIQRAVHRSARTLISIAHRVRTATPTPIIWPSTSVASSRAFSSTSPHVWYSLPLTIQTLSLDTFRRQLKTFPFSANWPSAPTIPIYFDIWRPTNAAYLLTYTHIPSRGWNGMLVE